jgi:hypothetical protein
MDVVELWTYGIRLVTNLEAYAWKSSCYLIHLSHRDPYIRIKFLLQQDGVGDDNIISLMLNWDNSGFSVWFPFAAPARDEATIPYASERQFPYSSFFDSGIKTDQEGLNDLMLGANKSLNNSPRQQEENPYRKPIPASNLRLKIVQRWLEPQLKVEELFGSLVVFLTFKVTNEKPNLRDVAHVRIERNLSTKLDG